MILLAYDVYDCSSLAITAIEDDAHAIRSVGFTDYPICISADDRKNHHLHGYTGSVRMQVCEIHCVHCSSSRTMFPVSTAAWQSRHRVIRLDSLFAERQSPLNSLYGMI